jgi:hypothetical protein
MGIAEFIIGRAFARPVGSTHPTCSGLEHDVWADDLYELGNRLGALPMYVGP